MNHRTRTDYGRMIAGLTALTAIIGIVCASTAHAASLRNRLEEAQKLLQENNPGKALDIYREIQVEHPDSEQAIFGAGCAQYQQGAAKMGAQAGDEAVTAFTDARASFERLLQSKDDRVRANAAFNRANCIAQSAKISASNPQNFEQGVNALREAAGAYEAVLKDFPHLEAARQNLDHVRYLLKKMLQNPPEKQDQKKDDKKPPEDQQPKMFSIFTDATTDIAGAKATINEDTVELVQPAQGAQP